MNVILTLEINSETTQINKDGSLRVYVEFLVLVFGILLEELFLVQNEASRKPLESTYMAAYIRGNVTPSVHSLLERYTKSRKCDHMLQQYIIQQSIMSF